MPRQHISDDQLDLYAVGTLPDDAAPEVEEHLLECEVCRARLGQSDEFAGLFRQAAALPEARPHPRWWSSRRWRAAAGFAAAAAVVVLFVASRREATVVVPAIVSMQSLRGPEAPARIEAGRPAILILDIETPVAAGYEVRVVDAEGKDVMRPRMESRDGRLSVAIDRLSKGSYWVRVYRAGGGDPVGEYGLQAR